MSEVNEHGLECPVDWSMKNPDFKWAVTDANGYVYIYEKKPKPRNGYWAIGGCRVDCVRKVERPIDFTKCLWQRPIMNEHGLPCPFPWKKAPKYAQWMATDRSGWVFAYRQKPIIVDGRIWGCLHYNYNMRFKKIGTVEKPDNFTLCLWERPKTNEQ